MKIPPPKCEKNDKLKFKCTSRKCEKNDFQIYGYWLQRFGEEKMETKKTYTPTVGLEPTTTRLRALRSTNWARRAFCLVFLELYFYFEQVAYVNLKLSYLKRLMWIIFRTSQLSNHSKFLIFRNSRNYFIYSNISFYNTPTHPTSNTHLYQFI